MKHKSTAAFLLLLPLSILSYAADPQQAAEPTSGMGTHQDMGTMSCCMTGEQNDQHMRSMQEHMLMMHDLSNQILTEKEPAKKESLKKQQLELMKTHHDQMMEHRKQNRQKQKQ